MKTLRSYPPTKASAHAADLIAKRKALRKTSSPYGQEFVDLPVTPGIVGSPIRALRNRDFLIQVRQHEGYQVMSVNRAALNNDGHWIEGISWDALQSMKEIVWPDDWAAEYFPPQGQVVCVANIRHIVRLDKPPVGAWKN